MLSSKISDSLLFDLLNLTKTEFNNLKHSPLMEYRNKFGVIIAYFVHISPQNEFSVLKKLKIGNSHFMTFTVHEVEVLMEAHTKLELKNLSKAS